MTEEIAATPGWVEDELDKAFTGLPDSTRSARDAYASCLARGKAAAAPSDLLGTEFETCRQILNQALLAAGVDHGALAKLRETLEALEAEYTAES